MIFCVARDTEITARFGFGGRYEPPAVMLCEKSFCLVFWLAVKNAFQSIEQFGIFCVPFFAVIIHKADAVQDIHKDYHFFVCVPHDLKRRDMVYRSVPILICCCA